MVNIKNIAVIPARGGSKRIPKKNIIDFFGKSMLQRAIESALQSGVINRIIVSTDCEEIAAEAERCGIEVPFLRNNAEDDYAGVSEATIAALKQSELHFDESYENVVQLMPNCPLRTGVTVLKCFQKFEELHADFLISCFKFGWMNPWWAFELDKQNSGAPKFPEALKMRSQDLNDLYCPTGSVWIAKVEALMASGTFYGPEFKYCPISQEEAMDIDDYEDLKIAKVFYLMRENESSI